MIFLYLANAVGATQRQTEKRHCALAIPVIRSQRRADPRPIAKQEANSQFRQGWKLERAHGDATNRPNTTFQPNDRAAPGAEPGRARDAS